jgi:hypothetical protein
MTVNKDLLRSKQASADKMIAADHLVEDHLRKEALGSSRFVV